MSENNIPADGNSIVVDWMYIDKCPACERNHENIEYIPITGNMAEYFDIYYICPISGVCVAIGRRK